MADSYTLFNPTISDPTLAARVAANVYDKNTVGRPMTDIGPVVRPDNTKLGGPDAANAGFNHFFMQVAEHFDPFIQKKTLAQPRFWHDRIPRGQFTLFQGTDPKTFIYRGGLTTYGGLSQWEKIVPDVTKDNNPCAMPKFSTYTYAWETLQFEGYKTAWGSDPICVDALKFQDQVQQQLAWILETGAEYGIAVQEVWNRDTYIRHSVLHDRSFVMSKDYVGAGSARYFYEPFTKFVEPGDSKANLGVGKANVQVINKPFIVIDASVEVEPLNFDTLERVGYELSQEAAEFAVSNGPDGPTFALMAGSDDMEKYFRGNEEYRKYWIEAKPEALIDGYGLRLKTFRGWAIVPDGNQARFHVTRHIASYTDDIAKDYGYVGFGTLANKEVFIAEFVEPRIEGRLGVNGSRVPAVNPDYFTAELAIAPVFMNNIMTNLFVPQVTSLGSGTSFGAVAGLNGKWGWMNIVDRQNPFGKEGNFYGLFELFQRPEPGVFYAISFLYRRCVQSIRSRCPMENPNVNPDLAAGSKATVTAVIDGAAPLTYATSGEATAAAAALNAKGAALVTLGTDTDVAGMVLGSAVKLTLNSVAMQGVFVTRKTNACRVQVALETEATPTTAGKVTYVANDKTVTLKIVSGSSTTAELVPGTSAEISL